MPNQSTEGIINLITNSSSSKDEHCPCKQEFCDPVNKLYVVTATEIWLEPGGDVCAYGGIETD